MKAFLQKYKGTIIFWLVFLTILYIAPRQSDYYLESDIKFFKSHYLIPTLIWTGVIISVLLLIILLARTKSIIRSLPFFLYGTLGLTFFLFIFQDLFLEGSLYINRQFKREIVYKNYTVTYLAGTDQTKYNFIPYDVSAKQISIDKKLINKLYNPGLKQNDTVTLQFDKGIFGIAFQSQPLNTK